MKDRYTPGKLYKVVKAQLVQNAWQSSQTEFEVGGVKRAYYFSKKVNDIYTYVTAPCTDAEEHKKLLSGGLYVSEAIREIKKEKVFTEVIGKQVLQIFIPFAQVGHEHWTIFHVMIPVMGGEITVRHYDPKSNIAATLPWLIYGDINGKIFKEIQKVLNEVDLLAGYQSKSIPTIYLGHQSFTNDYDCGRHAITNLGFLLEGKSLQGVESDCLIEKFSEIDKLADANNAAEISSNNVSNNNYEYEQKAQTQRSNANKQTDIEDGIVIAKRIDEANGEEFKRILGEGGILEKAIPVFFQKSTVLDDQTFKDKLKFFKKEILANYHKQNIQRSSLSNNLDGDINGYDQWGYTPLFYIVNDSKKIMLLKELFLDIDINIQSKNTGETAIFFAVSAGRYESVKILYELGARVDLVDFKGNNLLHEIANNHFSDIDRGRNLKGIAKFLLEEAGMDSELLTKKNKVEESPLDILLKRASKCNDIIQYLITERYDHSNHNSVALRDKEAQTITNLKQQLDQEVEKRIKVEQEVKEQHKKLINTKESEEKSLSQLQLEASKLRIELTTAQANANEFKFKYKAVEHILASTGIDYTKETAVQQATSIKGIVGKANKLLLTLDSTSSDVHANDLVVLTLFAAREAMENWFSLKYIAKNIFSFDVDEVPAILRSNFLWAGVHFGTGLIALQLMRGDILQGGKLSIVPVSLSSLSYLSRMLTYEFANKMLSYRLENEPDHSIEGVKDFVYKCGAESLISGVLSTANPLGLLEYPALTLGLNFVNGGILGSMHCYATHQKLNNNTVQAEGGELLAKASTYFPLFASAVSFYLVQPFKWHNLSSCMLSTKKIFAAVNVGIFTHHLSEVTFYYIEKFIKFAVNNISSSFMDCGASVIESINSYMKGSPTELQGDGIKHPNNAEDKSGEISNAVECKLQLAQTASAEELHRNAELCQDDPTYC